jgi:dATP pyrophosphohydrolase
MDKPYKIPVSVLVVIYTPDLQVLLLERADHPGYWQSVTGSQNPGETLRQTALREVLEETGLAAEQFELSDCRQQNSYEIYPEWRHRYAPGVHTNTEHVWRLKLPAPLPISLAEREHLRYAWYPYQEAAQRCFSPSNAAAIQQLPHWENPASGYASTWNKL